MATFKEITSADIQTTRSALSQLIDVVQNDVSGSTTRKGYAVFVTSSTGWDGADIYSVTSSLFQTVYDQDYTLQTANAVFDMTVGLYFSGSTVASSCLGPDSSGKLLFTSNSLMMREKIDMYRMHAGKLIGNSDGPFYSPFDSHTSDDRIDEAIFIDFKRLFMRDRIKRETFAMRFYTTGVLDGSSDASDWEKSIYNTYTGSNVGRTSVLGASIYTDVGAAANRRAAFGGDVGDIVNSANTNQKVGLLFYEAGVAVLDAKKIMWGQQHVSGVISAVTGGLAADALVNSTVIGSSLNQCNPSAKFIPDFFVSSSIDDIVDYLASTRFSSGSYTAVTFQNQTNINSTLLFCRASADEFNYSTNPTFTDSTGNLTVIEAGQEDVQRTFTFPTTVGLYDANNNLLAVAKFSRPIEKSDERDLTVRVRLDF
jgi:hypothetical protein